LDHNPFDTTRTGATLPSIQTHGFNIIAHDSRPDAQQLAESIVEKHYHAIRVFKDDSQTYSAQISIDGNRFILKIPRNRNNRPWERFLTLFRSSEAVRHYHSMGKLIQLGFQAPEPVLAAEKRVNGVVTDAFLLYCFAEGRNAGEADIPQVTSELIRLHETGYMRRDAHLKNYLMQDGEVVFIDFRLTRPRLFRQIRLQRELVIFLVTTPQALAHVPVEIQESLSFRIARRLHTLFAALKRSRRRIRRQLRSSPKR